MEAIDRGRKPVFIHVSVDFGGSDAGVAEQFLNHAEIGSTREKMGGKGVAQKVGVNAGVEAGSLGGSFDDSPKVGGGQATTVIPQKDLSPRFRADEFGSGGVKVTLDGFLGGLAQKNESLLIPFTDDTSTTSR
jgi:hypothetical protein